DVGDALRVLIGRTRGRAVGHADLALGVAQKREREVELLRELRVGLLVVEGDAEDFRVLLLVLRGEVPEPGTLGRSARGVGLRIEPEDDLAAEIGRASCRERDMISVCWLLCGSVDIEWKYSIGRCNV